MSLRTRPLPVVFVGAVLLSACIIFGYEAVRVDSFVLKFQRHPTAAVYFALASVGFAALAVAVVAVVREIRRANRPEMTGYREAVRTGRISGDAIQWPDWIRHDRKVNVFRGVGAAGLLCWGLAMIVNGPWWSAFVYLAGAIYYGWQASCTHQRLKALRTSLSASATQGEGSESL